MPVYPGALRVARHPPAGRVGPESAWLSWTGRDCNRLRFQTKGHVQGGVGDLAAPLTQPITIGHQNHSYLLFGKQHQESGITGIAASMRNRSLPAVLAQEPANANAVAVAHFVSGLPHNVIGLFFEDSPTIQLAMVQIGQ